MSLLQILILVASFGRFTQASVLDYDIEGNIYVVDRGADQVVKFTPRGDSLRTVGGRGRTELQFDTPVAIVARRGTDVYVADYNNHRVQRFDRALDYVGTVYTRDHADEQLRFGYPLDIAQSRQGDLFILDGENRRVLKVDPIGAPQTSFGGIATGAGRLIDPRAIEVDGEDNVYVLDGARMLIYDPFGSYIGDFANPLGARAVAMSIERDTLILSDSTTAYLFDLETRSSAGSYRLPASATSLRSKDGRIYAVERKRVAVYTRE